MTIEQLVEHNREQKRKQFGEVGLHDDCIHFGTANGKRFCNACKKWQNKKRHNEITQFLQCEKGVCYFYDPKRKENSNENQSNA